MKHDSNSPSITGIEIIFSNGCEVKSFTVQYVAVVCDSTLTIFSPYPTFLYPSWAPIPIPTLPMVILLASSHPTYCPLLLYPSLPMHSLPIILPFAPLPYTAPFLDATTPFHLILFFSIPSKHLLPIPLSIDTLLVTSCPPPLQQIKHLIFLFLLPWFSKRLKCTVTIKLISMEAHCKLKLKLENVQNLLQSQISCFKSKDIFNCKFKDQT